MYFSHRSLNRVFCKYYMILIYLYLYTFVSNFISNIISYLYHTLLCVTLYFNLANWLRVFIERRQCLCLLLYLIFVLPKYFCVYFGKKENDIQVGHG